MCTTCKISEKKAIYKSAQLTPSLNSKPTLGGRAKSKYLSRALASQLANLENSKIPKKSYENTIKCASFVEMKNGKLVSNYCGNRWCMVCNKIKTSKMIDGYTEPIKELAENGGIFLMTLTVLNMHGSLLPQAIKKMNADFRKILKKFNKRKTPIRGFKKLESTHNHKTKEFHPHFHCIVDSEALGKEFIDEWLLLNPTASIKGQDIKKSNINSVRELFKYVTKLFSSKTKNSDEEIDLEALDTIFHAMRGVRTFQPFGIKKSKKEVKVKLEKQGDDEPIDDIKEAVEDLKSIIYDDIDYSKLKEGDVFIWVIDGWVDRDLLYEYGELSYLIQYKPTDAMIKLISRFFKK